MRKKNNTIRINSSRVRARKAVTLIETLTVLMISAMIIMAVLTVFRKTKNAAASINRNLDKNSQSNEILQRIADDIDRLISPGFDTTIALKNKNESGYETAQLTIENKFYSKKKLEIFEKIIWQASYDPFEESLVLYRYHTGTHIEDKVFASGTDSAGTEEIDRFIPLCAGVTHFSIKVPQKNVKKESNKKETGKEEEVEEEVKMLDKWITTVLPKSVVVSISFAEPLELSIGEIEVPENERTVRTIAIDRIRKIPFVFVKKDFELEIGEQYDPNYIDESYEEEPETTEPNTPIAR